MKIPLKLIHLYSPAQTAKVRYAESRLKQGGYVML
jgi:hypothetical protein